MPRSKVYLFSDLTERIIKVAIDVHKTLGPGFTEKIYQRALYLELKRANLKFNREKKITIMFRKVNLGYDTVDFDVEDKVLVELKSVSELNQIHIAQLLSYLKAANRKIGLILNFAKPVLEIKRIAN